jgi:uncharacterized membrane protein YbaN (DUF454 family)
VTRGEWRRGPLLLAGFLCLALGLVGIVVPLLPTTPFLLLAAACFLRSSERMHRWLVGHRVLGPYLRRDAGGAGMSRATLVVLLVLLWTSLALSAFLAVPPGLGWVRLLLLAVGVGVTAFLLRARAPSGPRGGPKP